MTKAVTEARATEHSRVQQRLNQERLAGRIEVRQRRIQDAREVCRLEASLFGAPWSWRQPWRLPVAPPSPSSIARAADVLGTTLWAVNATLLRRKRSGLPLDGGLQRRLYDLCLRTGRQQIAQLSIIEKQANVLEGAGLSPDFLEIFAQKKFPEYHMKRRVPEQWSYAFKSKIFTPEIRSDMFLAPDQARKKPVWCHYRDTYFSSLEIYYDVLEYIPMEARILQGLHILTCHVPSMRPAFIEAIEERILELAGGLTIAGQTSLLQAISAVEMSHLFRLQRCDSLTQLVLLE